MVDAPNIYRWWSYAKSISRKEIETMKKNMKKVPTIQLKSDVYHNKEAVEAEEILQNINKQNDSWVEEQKQPIKTKKLPWYKKIFHRISHLFTSSL
jgi:hypothetical protein